MKIRVPLIAVAIAAALLPCSGMTEEGEGEALDLSGGGTKSGGVSLEGNWAPYESTSLSVKRSITVEREGQSYQAEVYAPVLSRRGALFLSKEDVQEMLAIQAAIEGLREEMAKIRKTANELSARYGALVGKSYSIVPSVGDVLGREGKVKFVNGEEN